MHGMTLIRNAQVVFPDQVATSNILLRDGKIASVDAAPNTRADAVIDASELVLFPGLIDDQVHFREATTASPAASSICGSRSR